MLLFKHTVGKNVSISLKLVELELFTGSDAWPGVRPDVIECRAVGQSTVDNLTEDCRPINTVEDNSLTEVLKAALQERRAP